MTRELYKPIIVNDAPSDFRVFFNLKRGYMVSSRFRTEKGAKNAKLDLEWRLKSSTIDWVP